jgi:hypothetical protein
LKEVDKDSDEKNDEGSDGGDEQDARREKVVAEVERIFDEIKRNDAKWKAPELRLENFD